MILVNRNTPRKNEKLSIEAFAAKSDDLSLISETQTVEGEN